MVQANNIESDSIIDVEDEEDFIKAEPLFGRPLPYRSKSNWSDIFVLLPLKDPFLTMYRDSIEPIVHEFNVTCKHAEDFRSAKEIVKEIWSAIFYSTLCIADCTGQNPNVFYEIGIAHTIGRPTILLSQSADDLPFDVKHRRAIIYEYTPSGMKRFEEDLRNTLQEELQIFSRHLEIEQLLEEATDIYMQGVSERTRKTYKSRIETFLQWRDSQDIESLPSQFRQYLDFLGEEGLSPATTKNYFFSLKGLVRTAAELNPSLMAPILFELDHIELPANDISTPRMLSEEEIHTFLNAPQKTSLAGLRDVCILALMTLAGLKTSDIVELCWGQLIEIESGFVIQLGDNQVIIPQWLHEYITQWGRRAVLDVEDPNETVFKPVTKDDRALKERVGISKNAVTKIVRKYAHKAQLGEISTRDLKYTAKSVESNLVTLRQ